MPPHSPLTTTNPAPESLLDGILNASLNGIIAYESIRDDAGLIIDFRAIAVNRVAQQILGLSDAEPGWQLLAHFPATLKNGSFDRYVRVTETGVADRFDVDAQEHVFTSWYNVSAVRFNNGFVATFSDVTEERETITDLVQRNALLDSILESSPSSIFNLIAVRDEAGHVRDFRFGMMNEKAVQDITRDFGRSPINALLSGVNQDTYQTGQFRTFVNVVETGTPITQEHFYPTLGLWYQMAIAKIDDGVVVTATDVTARKQAALEIEQQTALNNAMLDGLLNGLLLLDPVYDDHQTVIDFLVLAANPSVEKLSGVGPEQAIGQRMKTLYPGYEDAGYFGLYVDTLQTGQPGKIETYYEDDKGLAGWFEVSSVRQGKTVVVTFANTTEFRQAEQALKRAAENLQNVIDQSQTGIFVFSPVYDEHGIHYDFRFKTINRMVAALVGQTPDVLTGAVASDWFTSYRETGLFDKYKHTLLTGEEQRFDINYTVDGFDIWFDVHSVEFGNDVLITFTDYSNQKRLQLAQEKQSDFLNSVLNSTSNGIMVFEALRNEAGGIIDLIITNANATGAGIANKSIDQLLGSRALADFPGIRETGLYDLYVETIDTGQSGSKELHYHTDGLDVFVTVGTRKLGDGLVVTYNDISETRRLSLFAEQQASLLDSVLNSSVNGIMAFASIRNEAGQIQDFRFLTSNESSCRMVGRSEVELVGTSLLSVFPGNVQSGLFAQYVNTVETGQPTRTDIEYTADGLNFWLDISAQKLADGFVVTFTDISLIKRAAQVVEKSAAELQAVIDTAQTGIYVFVPVYDGGGELIDFRFRLANYYLANYAGLQANDLTGELASTFFVGYKINGLFERYKVFYESNQPQTRFDFHYDTDGLDVWLDLLVTKRNGELLITFNDFTNLKKLQQQLEASVIDLQRSNKNLEQFAYVASHDLQEPLRKIQQFGDILQTSYGNALDESGQDMLRRMQSAAERMRVLIKDVLDYSRLATKRETVKPVDLNKLLREVTGDLETAISKTNALVEFDTLPTVAGEAVQLRQLFQNLIGNALKFAKPDRQPKLSLRYTVQRGRDTGLPVSATDEARQFYRLELSDNGIGFEPHQAEKIFQVFQRLHNRNEYQGTGIGLAIVQKVIENHQGYIRAEGRPDEGATFTMLLPV